MKNVDLHIKPAKKLLISSSGQASGLLDAVFGLRQLNSGYICLNNQDLRELNLGLLRNTVCLVRETEIFEGSIEENLRLGLDMDLTEIRNILATVGLLNKVATMPEGFNTELFPNGSPLSHEECLRLTLARALVCRPNLLLLDGILDRIAV